MTATQTSRPRKRPLLDFLIGTAFIVSLALGIGFFGIGVAIALWLCVFIPALTFLINRDELGDGDAAHAEQKKWGRQ